MTKAQYDGIIAHIEAKHKSGYRLRLHMSNGEYVQGTVELVGTRTLIVNQDTNQIAYADLDRVDYITVG